MYYNRRLNRMQRNSYRSRIPKYKGHSFRADNDTELEDAKKKEPDAIQEIWNFLNDAQGHIADIIIKLNEAEEFATKLTQAFTNIHALPITMQLSQLTIDPKTQIGKIFNAIDDTSVTGPGGAAYQRRIRDVVESYIELGKEVAKIAKMT